MNKIDEKQLFITFITWVITISFIYVLLAFEVTNTYILEKVHAELEPSVSETLDVSDPQFEVEEPDMLHEEIQAVRSVEEEKEEIVEEDVHGYFDVPLSEDLQDHIFMVCESYGIDPAIVIAMIQRESNFVIDIVGDNGNSFGLMQIQPRWHRDRMEKLGCTDLLNPYQNVNVGVDYLAELFEKGKSVEWVLMAYNGGPSYANKKAANGEVNTYARDVIEKSERLKRDI